MPPVWPGAAWRLQPATERSTWPQVHWGPSPWCTFWGHSLGCTFWGPWFLHQWGWSPTLSISALIHQLGWSTGSGIPLSQDMDWDWAAAEGMTGAFGQATPMWVGWSWWPSLQSGCGGSTVKGMEGLGALSYSLAVSPLQEVGEVHGQCRFITQIFTYLESDLFLHWVFGWTLFHQFLQKRRMFFGVCGSAKSPHPALGFPWLGVQVKITQGVAKLLISRMWLQGAGRGRLVPAWRLGQGISVSLLLVPMPWMATLPPGSWLPCQRVFSWSFGQLPPGLGWRDQAQPGGIYFVKLAYPVLVHSRGQLWPYPRPVQSVTPLYTHPAASGGAHWEASTYSSW